MAATVRPSGPPGPGPLLLELDLTGGLAAAPPPDLLGRVQAARGLTLTGVVRRLADAEDDPAVAGLVAKLGGGRLRLAQAQEVAAAIRSFREAGKRTWAWAETFGELGPGTPGYTLATAFDEIWLQPSGDVGLTGVAVEGLFLREALDRAGIEPQFDQRYEYKNAADLLLRREFTPAHREASERLAGSALDQVVTQVAGGRGLAPDAVRELVDRAPLSAAAALEARLVDRLGYRQEVYAAAREATGDGVRLRYLAAYRRHRAPAERARETLRRRVAHRRAGVVALIHAAGEIRLGRSGRGLQGPALGSDSLTAALRAAADDDQVRAVVLRVDSPGGSYVASDAVWGAVTALKATGRPVVVSMGTVAGSGGYFISCPADVIVALPTTLTGSIGVLGGKPVVVDLLARWGVGTDAVTAGRHARMSSVRARYSDGEWQRLQESLDRIYDDFTSKVALSRRLERDHVHEVARGRVWTGVDARDRGLVDELGGLRRAAEIARERAGLPFDAELRPFPHVPLLAQLRRPKSSEDPSGVADTPLLGGTSGSLADLLGALGLSPAAFLLMPPIALR
ncbi:MAG: S49 family peptidase [Kineosporiaceae bacterium]